MNLNGSELTGYSQQSISRGLFRLKEVGANLMNLSLIYWKLKRSRSIIGKGRKVEGSLWPELQWMAEISHARTAKHGGGTLWHRTNQRQGGKRNCRHWLAAAPRDLTSWLGAGIASFPIVSRSVDWFDVVTSLRACVEVGSYPHSKIATAGSHCRRLLDRRGGQRGGGGMV